MIRILHGKPMPYRIQLDRADDATRRKLITWCRDNFPYDGNTRWIPPYRPDPSKVMWFSGPNEDTWCFLREEDAVFFDLTWDGQ